MGLAEGGGDVGFEQWNAMLRRLFVRRRERLGAYGQEWEAWCHWPETDLAISFDQIPAGDPPRAPLIL